MGNTLPATPKASTGTLFSQAEPLMPCSLTTFKINLSRKLGLGHIHGSFDARSRNLSHMFNFGGKHGKNKVLLLDPATGQPQA